MNENTNSSSKCARSLQNAADILKVIGIVLVCLGALRFISTLTGGSGYIVSVGLPSLIAGVISFVVFWVFSLFCSAISEITMSTRECANYMKTMLSGDEEDEND